MSRKIEDMDSRVQPMARTFLAELDKIGFKYVVTETLRTREVQQAYFAQGRRPLADVNQLRAIARLAPITESANANKITNVDGVNSISYHQTGRALDIVPLVGGKPVWDTKSADAKALWLKLGETGKKHGFSWGGDWGKTASALGWDCPHFEVKI